MKLFTASQAKENVVNFKTARVDEARVSANEYLETINKEIQEASTKGKSKISYNFAALKNQMVTDFIIGELRSAGYKIRFANDLRNVVVSWE